MRSHYSIRLAKARRAVLDLDYIDDGWWISRVNVPAGFRGNGYGTLLLEQVLEEADYEGVDLNLEIYPYGDLDFDRLREWYERHGFKYHPQLGYFIRVPGSGE